MFEEETVQTKNISPTAANDDAIAADLDALLVSLEHDLPADLPPDLQQEAIAQLRNARRNPNANKNSLILSAASIKSSVEQKAEEREVITHAIRESVSSMMEVRLSAATMAKIEIRSGLIELNNEAALDRFVSTYEHPKEMKALLRANPEMVEEYNKLPKEVKKERHTAIESYREITKQLLGHFPDGKTHELLLKVNAHGLMRYSAVDEVLDDFRQVNPEDKAAVNKLNTLLAAAIDKSEVRMASKVAARHIPAGTSQSSVNAMMDLQSVIDGDVKALTPIKGIAGAFKAAAISGGGLGGHQTGPEARTQALTSLVAQRHPDLNAAHVQAEAQKYIQQNNPKIPVDLNGALKAAMLNGYNAMKAGNPEVARKFAAEVEQVMRDNGYPADDVRTVGSVLRRGAELGSTAAGRVALNTMSPSALIDLTLHDIDDELRTGKSTPLFAAMTGASLVKNMDVAGIAGALGRRIGVTNFLKQEVQEQVNDGFNLNLLTAQSRAKFVHNGKLDANEAYGAIAAELKAKGVDLNDLANMRIKGVSLDEGSKDGQLSDRELAIALNLITNSVAVPQAAAQQVPKAVGHGGPAAVAKGK